MRMEINSNEERILRSRIALFNTAPSALLMVSLLCIQMRHVKGFCNSPGATVRFLDIFMT